MADTETRTQEAKTHEERLPFQAEVSRLLDIVANSLYSEKEIFLRELISNASDACDRLRYAALTQPELAAGNAYAIEITLDKKARRLSVADNGIGMSREELVENLGTIARSGTLAFMERLAENGGRGDLNLIGQFGVGFYSAFMVADRVEVLTRKAGEAETWRWSSDGRSGFSVAPAEEEVQGTVVTLHLREDADEYLEAERIRRIVKTYSDHIPFPIRLSVVEDGKTPDAPETLNRASALWTRPRKEIDEQQYREFYRHVAHAGDDPWLTLHFKAEGVIEYTGLLFVPGARPLDIFHPDRRPRVKLYVRRVFITEDCEDLVPTWLRFLRGIIDSEDLPLNISREVLQNNPVVAKIRAGLTRRVLTALAEKAEKEPESYARFWDNFGAVLKEGLYEDFEHREQLFKLARFRSTAEEGLVTLADYAARMKKGQKAIYYITGDELEALEKSPQLEGFRDRGVEVLLMTDPVDEFWLPAVGVYESHPFKSVTKGAADLAEIAAPEDGEKTEERSEKEPAGLGDLIALLKITLGDAVKDVRVSDRLTTSAVCLVADEDDLDMHLQRLLKQHNQLDRTTPRILEINPRHELIRGLAARAADKGAAEELADAAHLLLDQARILEGEPLPDPAAHARRMAAVMARGFGVAQTAG